MMQSHSPESESEAWMAPAPTCSASSHAWVSSHIAEGRATWTTSLSAHEHWEYIVGIHSSWHSTAPKRIVGSSWIYVFKIKALIIFITFIIVS